MMIVDGANYSQDKRPAMRQGLAGAVQDLQNAFELALTHVTVWHRRQLGQRIQKQRLKCLDRKPNIKNE